MKRILSVLLSLLLLPVCTAVRAEESSAYGYVARLVDSGESAAPKFITIDDKATAEKLLWEGVISYYEVNCPVFLPDVVETDPAEAAVSLLASEYWQHTAINLHTMGGRGITVGIIDSGVSSHEAFGSRLLTGYNALTDTTDTVDTDGHGTRVAGMVASDTIGVAPGASIYPIKCFNSKSTTLSAILKGMENGIENGCDILNMSFGVPVDQLTVATSQSFADMVAYALEHNVLVVAAVGNDSDDTINYPAGLDNVIGVGGVVQSSSTASGYTRYDRSNYNYTVDIVAPSNCCGAPDKDSTTDYVTADEATQSSANGTSFACPMIAGVLALGLAYKPDLDPYVVADALLVSAKDLGGEGWDAEYGFGLADVVAFLEELDHTDETRITRRVVQTDSDGKAHEGLVVYNAGDTPLMLYGAAYEDGEAREMTKFSALSMAPGYNVVVISKLLVYLFDVLSPVMEPIDFRNAGAAVALEEETAAPAGMELFSGPPIV